MKIGAETVTTPMEDPVFYDMDWRFLAADSAAKGGVSNPFPGDACVGNWLRYIHGRRTDRAVRELHVRVKALRESERLAPVLDAMLLTGADYGTVAADLPGLTPEQVQLYEKSFFNVRADGGELRPAHLLRIRFRDGLQRAGDTAEAELMRAALAGGYGLVKELWAGGISGNAKQATDLATVNRELIERELTRRVLDGRMETRDLLRMKQVQIEAERFRQETLATGSGADEAWGLFRGVLELVAPKMAQPQGDAKATNEALRNRMAAEQRIAAQPVEDRGAMAASAAMHDRLRQRAAGADCR
jgi:hypothetical protein